MPTEPTIRKSTHDLALLIAGQVHTAQLPEDVERHFLKNKDEIPSAIARGFILQGQEAAPVAIVTPAPAVISTAEQTLDWWLAKTEEFSKRYLGAEINLRERFAIPAELPWGSIIPVFDPGSLTNRDMVKKALGGLNLGVYEETDVMKYAGSKAGEEPTLHFIENSVRPNEDTMNMSPNQLRDTKKLFLRLRGYGLAMAVYHFATGEYLDPETFTWFPEDRLPGGRVAFGDWDGSSSRVRFYWSYPDYRGSCCGARVAMPVSLKP